MTKTPKKLKSVPKASFNLAQWNTTDAQEIERRVLLAKIQRRTFQILEPEHPYFGSFSVGSLSQTIFYTVEIRSLSECINSCDCLDYEINGLGTCKHIEYTLLKLQKKGKKLFCFREKIREELKN